MSETRRKILEKIRGLESHAANRMEEHRRFMERFIDERDHIAKERADQVMHIWQRHRNEIAELKKKLTELD